MGIPKQLDRIVITKEDLTANHKREELLRAAYFLLKNNGKPNAQWFTDTKETLKLSL